MDKKVPKEKALNILNKWITKILNLSKNINIKIKIITSLITIFIASYNLKMSDFQQYKNNDIIQQAIVSLYDRTDNLKPFNSFLDDLAYRESKNDWTSVNKYGYIGKYQFGEIAFKDVNHNVIDAKEFQKNPKIFPEHKQDELMIKLLKNNKHYLRDYMSYVGKEVKGIKITLSGLLAGSHLVGNTAVKKFLDSEGKIDIQDAMGTKCSEYIKNFSGYKLNLGETYKIKNDDNIVTIIEKNPEININDITKLNNLSYDELFNLKPGQKLVIN